jgi:hypothetical protein
LDEELRYQVVLLEFIITLILPAALQCWGIIRLQKKRVAGIFHGGKGGRCVGLTTLPLLSAKFLET